MGRSIISNSIKIVGQTSANSWKQGCSLEDWVEVFELLRDPTSSSPTFCAVSGVIKPIRIDSAENFFKDLFFPTLLNHAVKVNGIARKVLACSSVALLDLATLPIRLITCIPRLLFDESTSREENQFFRYLQQRGVSQEILAGDYIHVELTVMINKESEEENGRVRVRLVENAVEATHVLSLSRDVFFIERQDDTWVDCQHVQRVKDLWRGYFPPVFKQVERVYNRVVNY